jgi:patatin-like phospholipase/acyl hydrolase
MAKYRILSIDGGGTRGIIPARILQEIETISGYPISKLFDLVVGTSSGGMTALALVCPVSLSPAVRMPKFKAKDLVSLYLDQSVNIFRKSLWSDIRTLWGALAPRYDRTPLDGILNEMFEETCMSDTLCRAIIPSFSLKTYSPIIFGESGKPDHYVSDVAIAATAAPVYFSPKKIIDTKGLHPDVCVDGGIWANNPETIGVSCALKENPGLTRDDIYILSIGSGKNKVGKRSVQDSFESHDSGFLKWMLECNVVDLILNAESDWEQEEMNFLYKNMNRLQFQLPVGFGDLDDSSAHNMQILLNRSELYIRDHKQELEDIVSKVA